MPFRTSEPRAAREYPPSLRSTDIALFEILPANTDLTFVRGFLPFTHKASMLLIGRNAMMRPCVVITEEE